jgi:hypothetical protein
MVRIHGLIDVSMDQLTDGRMLLLAVKVRQVDLLSAK